MSFGPLLHALKAAYRLEMALFVEEQPLRQLMFAEGLDPDVLTEQNRRGKYTKVHSTNWALMKELVSEGDLSGPAEAQYVRSAQDVPYGVVLLTLFNHAGNPIGKVAMARDFSSSRAAAGRSLVWQGLLALTGIVVLAGVILIVVRGLLLRPLEMLSRHFVNLAEGRRRPTDPRDREPLRRDASAGPGSRAAQDQVADLGPQDRQRGVSMKSPPSSRSRALLRLGIARARRATGSADGGAAERLSARCLWVRACRSSF